MTVNHKDLTTTALHEPKGVAAASANTLYGANGSGSGTWAKIDVANMDTSSVKNVNRLAITYEFTNMSTATSKWVAVPLAGKILKIYSVMDDAITSVDNVFTFEHCSTVSDMNPEIAPPLRLTDCSLVTDGAAALILTTDENAATFPKSVAMRAAEHVNDFLPMSRRDFLAFEGPERAFAQAFKAANVTLDDIDFAEVHDCFTIAELLTYEAMGLAPKGQGARALEDGTVYRGGALPVNLSGGLKAKGHPVGATGVSMLALAFRQLTNQAGDLQVPGAELGLLFNMGGSAVANYVSVLEARKV